MLDYEYIYGPVPSRRMGLSVGVSPIRKKYCNYSCIYCQLGRTKNLSNKREEFFKISEIIKEFKDYGEKNFEYDVVTIVGEGEPTLYSKLGELIDAIKKITDKPIAVITNGALLCDSRVREELMSADIVLPSLDAANKEKFKMINRPYGTIKFDNIIEGMRLFSQNFEGQLWIETMILKDINDSIEDFKELKTILDTINFDRLYINSPVRPPAEGHVKQPTNESIKNAVEILEGTSINKLASEGFYSNIEDDYESIRSIISRHPMNQHEIDSFLQSRDCEKIKCIFKKLENDDNIEIVKYRGYKTYRLK